MHKIGFAIAALVFLGLFVLDSNALLQIAGMALTGAFGMRLQVIGTVALAASVFLIVLALTPRATKRAIARPRKAPRPKVADRAIVDNRPAGGDKPTGENKPEGKTNRQGKMDRSAGRA